MLKKFRVTNDVVRGVEAMSVKGLQVFRGDLESLKDTLSELHLRPWGPQLQLEEEKYGRKVWTLGVGRGAQNPLH